MDPTRAASPETMSTSPTSSDPFLSPCQSAESMSSAELPRRKYPAHLSNGIPRSNQRYETMEELLSAAGYSVTRIFTPETEGPKESAKEKKEEGIGGRVVGWFANILPASSPSSPVDKEPEPEPEPEPEENGKSQAARSLRTHLMTRALLRSDPPTLRHATSAPALSVPRSTRRRAIPSAWRDEAPAWSGGFVVKQPDQRLWFSDDSRASTIRANTQTIRANPQTVRANPRTNLGVRNPLSLRHRARSAPRPVPAPAPPVRPSPVVQQNVVVCRSVSSFGSSSSVQTRSSTRTDESCPVLTPEPATDGLPPTPSRPTIVRQRSGILRRERSIVIEVDDEPDLASIIHAYRPCSPRTTGRQASIRSLRALLKDPKFPDVPVVCVASPGTVSAGGPGRAVWLGDD